jgi:MGT family glycosyltransferase
MARILVYTSPARGHLYPVVPIMSELRRRGHTVALRTLASQVTMMRELGIEAAPIAPAIEAIRHDDHLARTSPGGTKRSVHVLCERAVHEVADLRAAVERERPDALLVDVNTYGAAALAESWGGPWAAWWPFPTPLPSPAAPPFGPGLRPAGGPLGRLRDAVLRPVVLGAAQQVLRPRVNRIRAGVGLPGLPDAMAAFTAPPLVLYLTAEPFEYPRPQWPANVRMVGPCDWDPPTGDLGRPEEDGAPLVLVTTSSEFQSDARLVSCALAALADEPFRVVVTATEHGRHQFRTPPNATVLPFTAHAPLLARAVCAVTHGGMGVTQKALAHGVPVCAVPFGRDQPEVARRVEHAGAGTRLPARRLRPDRLRAAVREAIGRRAGAQRVADAFRAAGGPVAAADAFERLLASPAGSVPVRSVQALRPPADVPPGRT